MRDFTGNPKQVAAIQDYQALVKGLGFGLGFRAVMRTPNRNLKNIVGIY